VGVQTGGQVGGGKAHKNATGSLLTDIFSLPTSTHKTRSAEARCQEHGIVNLQLVHLRGDPRSRSEMRRLIDVTQFKGAIVLCGERGGTCRYVGGRLWPWVVAGRTGSRKELMPLTRCSKWREGGGCGVPACLRGMWKHPNLPLYLPRRLPLAAWRSADSLWARKDMNKAPCRRLQTHEPRCV